MINKNEDTLYRWNHDFDYPYSPRVLQLDDLTIFTTRKVATRWLSTTFESELFDLRLAIKPIDKDFPKPPYTKFGESPSKVQGVAYFDDTAETIYNENIQDYYSSLELFQKSCQNTHNILNSKTNQKAVFLYRNPKYRFRSGFIQEVIDFLFSFNDNPSTIHIILSRMYQNDKIKEFIEIFKRCEGSLDLLYEEIALIELGNRKINIEDFTDMFTDIIIYCLNIWSNNKKIFESHTKPYLIYYLYIKQIARNDNIFFINIDNSNLRLKLEKILGKTISNTNVPKRSNEFFNKSFENALCRIPLHLVDSINDYLQSDNIAYRYLNYVQV